MLSKSTEEKLCFCVTFVFGSHMFRATVWQHRWSVGKSYAPRGSSGGSNNMIVQSRSPAEEAFPLLERCVAKM
jgi:hypothetical protein